jgi:hypothetical protein
LHRHDFKNGAVGLWKTGDRNGSAYTNLPVQQSLEHRDLLAPSREDGKFEVVILTPLRALRAPIALVAVLRPGELTEVVYAGYG